MQTGETGELEEPGEGCSTFYLLSMLCTWGIRVKRKKGFWWGAKSGVAAREGRKKRKGDSDSRVQVRQLLQGEVSYQ